MAVADAVILAQEEAHLECNVLQAARCFRTLIRGHPTSWKKKCSHPENLKFKQLAIMQG